MHFNLYHTLGCHLCDLAEEIIRDFNQQSQSNLKIQFTKIDIATDDALIQQFGVRIPVLENPNSKSTLDWPFNLSELILFVRQN